MSDINNVNMSQLSFTNCSVLDHGIIYDAIREFELEIKLKDIEGLRVNTGARLLYTFYATVMDFIYELKLKNDIEYIGMSKMMCDDDQRRYPVSFAPNPGLLFNSILKLI
jgi:hypothetical protein